MRPARSNGRVLRRLGGAARIRLAFELSREAREISLAGIRSRDSQLTAAQALRELLRRILGDELWAAAYGRRGS